MVSAAALITVLACPIITKEYDAYPMNPMVEAIRLGTSVNIISEAPDKSDRISIKLTSGSSKKTYLVPSYCVGKLDQFKVLNQWENKNNQFTFCEGDYCPVYKIAPNGKVKVTFGMFEGAGDLSKSEKAETAKKICSDGKVDGSSCVTEAKVLKNHDLYMLSDKKGINRAFFYIRQDGVLESPFPSP